jgi:H/ACA ribonucleoprotein complex subunit 4
MQINLEQLKQKKSINELLEFGIIILDKPTNMTSFDVSDFVRRKLKLRKTSHFGTLDPMVTGVLPIALNRACKLTGFFLGEDKEYIGTMRIHEDISIEKIKDAIKKGFIGKIMQIPPVKSRVKRQEREREIKKFEILEKNGKDVSFIVECQGGTYIRKLIHDLGEEMGIGAHMIQLRRIRAGIFRQKEIITKEQFEKAVEEYEKRNDEKLREIIIPAEIVSEVYNAVEVKKEFVEKLLHGSPILEEFLIKKMKLEKNKIISVFSEEKFIGMYKVTNEKNIFAKSLFVLQKIKE